MSALGGGEIERADLLERRSEMAKAVLDILLIALDDDSPPTNEVAVTAIQAAAELLAI